MRGSRQMIVSCSLTQARGLSIWRSLMKAFKMRLFSVITLLAIGACLMPFARLSVQSQSATLNPAKQLARDIFQQLIEINTTDSVGDCTAAANAMAERLKAAGFPEEDVKV